MNFPGVINENHEVINKIRTAKKYGKPIDGHAPGLTGEMLKNIFLMALVRITNAQLLMKLRKNRTWMKILIREGSAARNLDELKASCCLIPK